MVTENSTRWALFGAYLVHWAISAFGPFGNPYGNLALAIFASVIAHACLWALATRRSLSEFSGELSLFYNFSLVARAIAQTTILLSWPAVNSGVAALFAILISGEMVWPTRNKEKGG